MFITKRNTTTTTFCRPHVALLIPEIVGHILTFVAPNPTTPTSKNNTIAGLLQCLRVNQLWHDCAARLIWRDVSFDESSYNALVKFANIVGEIPDCQGDATKDAPVNSTSTSTASSLAVASNPIIRHTSLFSNCLEFLFMPPTPPADDDEDNRTMVDDMPFNDSKETQTAISPISPLSLSSTPAPSNMPFYRSVLRSLTVRKVKRDTINNLLCDKIARHCDRLEHIELYICDHVKDATLAPLIQHGRLTHLSLAGCYQITDQCIIQVAEQCSQLEHLDLRACGQVSDVSISAIAMQCRALKHLNVGRVRDRHHITVKSIRLIAMHTNVAVLGLAGCQIDDECMLLLAQHRNHHLERISVNSCHRITNITIRAYAQHCPNLSVFEMKECHLIDDWETVVALAQRKVLMTLCEQQDRACSAWAQKQGVAWTVKSPRGLN